MEDGEPTLSGWGRHRGPGVERIGEDLASLSEGVPLCRGLGRSYGDASLPPVDHALALNTTRADRILSFDERTGRIRAEAGLSLAELNRIFMPRLWFSPVTPGTQFVTLGGMVAADVHGKNQHLEGNFGDYVTQLKLRVADGRVIECSAQQHADLFQATIGGMGLSGHILEVEFSLQRIASPWICQRTQRIANIDAFQEALEKAAQDWPYTAGWIDASSRGEALGRGILMCGRWATLEEAPRRSPRKRLQPKLSFDWPAWVLNQRSIRAFNELYFRKQLRVEHEGLVNPESFFYPLDAIAHWNRMYGKRGFTQYQCVLPREAGHDSARRVMEVLTKEGGASFLCVIKDFGKEGRGLLSFPRPGITLALDIPVRDNTQSLIDTLNECVIEQGGRIYLAKDSFTRREHFKQMEGERLERFNEFRDRWDKERKLRSALSQRLLGD